MNTAKKDVEMDRLNRRSAIRPIHPEHRKSSDSLRLNMALPHASVKVRKAVDEAVSDARERLGILFTLEGRSIAFPKLNDAPIVIPRELADAFIWDIQNALGFRNIKIRRSEDSIEIVKGDEDDASQKALG